MNNSYKLVEEKAAEAKTLILLDTLGFGLAAKQLHKSVTLHYNPKNEELNYLVALYTTDEIDFKTMQALKTAYIELASTAIRSSAQIIFMTSFDRYVMSYQQMLWPTVKNGEIQCQEPQNQK